MRYVLATCFACAIGTPAAFATPGALVTRGNLAMPGLTSEAALVRKADRVPNTAKHGPQRAGNKSSQVRRDRGLGGIHPLVGSGDY
jgi:hypothetical protein